MTRLILLVAFSVLFLGGCAITPVDEKNLNQAKSDVICRKEKKTGSLMPVRICRPRESSPIDKENTQRDLRRIMTQSEQINRVDQ